MVGSKANAYINLGLLLDWEFAPMWNLTVGVGLTHFSNGNTRYPNAGVNSIGGRIGVSRSFEGPGKVKSSLTQVNEFRRHMTYDLILYGASRKKAINIGLGRNLICRGKDTDGWYNIFALKADVWHDCFIHIGYQLYNFKNPNNLMLGIGYRFNNGRSKARK